MRCWWTCRGCLLVLLVVMMVLVLVLVLVDGAGGRAADLPCWWTCCWRCVVLLVVLVGLVLVNALGGRAWWLVDVPVDAWVVLLVVLLVLVLVDALGGGLGNKRTLATPSARNVALGGLAERGGEQGYALAEFAVARLVPPMSGPWRCLFLRRRSCACAWKNVSDNQGSGRSD